MAASSIILLSLLGHFGNERKLDNRLIAAYEKFDQWCRANHRTSAIDEFSKQSFGMGSLILMVFIYTYTVYIYTYIYICQNKSIYIYSYIHIYLITYIYITYLDQTKLCSWTHVLISGLLETPCKFWGWSCFPESVSISPRHLSMCPGQRVPFPLPTEERPSTRRCFWHGSKTTWKLAQRLEFICCAVL